MAAGATLRPRGTTVTPIEEGRSQPRTSTLYVAAATCATIPWGSSIPVESLRTSVTGLATALLAIYWLSEKLTRGLRVRAVQAALPLVGIALLLLSFSLLSSRHDIMARFYVLIYAVTLSIILCELCARPRFYSGVVTGYWLGTLVLAGQVIAAYYYRIDLGDRVIVEGINPNTAALYLAIGVVAAWDGVRRTSGIAAVVRALSIPLLAGTVVLTGSRSGLLALIAAALLFAASAVRDLNASYLTSRLRTRSLWFFAILAGAAATMAYRAPVQVLERSMGALRPAETLSAGDVRPRLFADGLEQLADQWYVFGGGLGSSRFPAVEVGQVETAVHNTVLEFAIEGGVLTLACLALIAVRVWGSRRVTPTAAWTSSALLAVWLAGSLTHSRMMLDITWFVIGVCASHAASYPERTDGPRKTPNAAVRESSPAGQGTGW